MEQFTTFFIIVAFVLGIFAGRVCTVAEFNDQRKARARMRRAIRSNR